MTVSIKLKLELVICAVLCLAGTVTETGAGEGQSSPKDSFTATGRTRAGRDIKASGDVPLGVRVQKDTAAVMCANHTLTIEKKKVLLDGKERAKIPGSALAVEVICANHVISVVADKKPVLNVNLSE